MEVESEKRQKAWSGNATEGEGLKRVGVRAGVFMMLPVGLLGHLWPGERVVMGLSVSKWFRTELTAHAEDILLVNRPESILLGKKEGKETPEGSEEILTSLEENVCRSLKRYKHGKLSVRLKVEPRFFLHSRYVVFCTDVVDGAVQDRHASVAQDSDRYHFARLRCALSGADKESVLPQACRWRSTKENDERPRSCSPSGSTPHSLHRPLHSLPSSSFPASPPQSLGHFCDAALRH